MDDFATAARTLCGLLLDAPGLPLQQRVEALGDTLALVVFVGRALPPVAAPGTPPPPGPAADGWPGLGSFEELWAWRAADEPPEPAVLSELLLSVERWLWAGLQAWEAGEVERAAGWWAGGWPAWGTDAVAALGALHHAGLRYREVPRERRAGGPEVVELVSQAHQPLLATEPPADGPPGVLGVRFEPIGVGALVREIHPDSPAAAVLAPGDVVLSVDGRPLDEDPDALKEQLAGPVGRRLRCEVYREGETLEVVLATVDPETL